MTEFLDVSLGQFIQVTLRSSHFDPKKQPVRWLIILLSIYMTTEQTAIYLYSAK